MKKPFFTIMMPTRNRAGLLRESIKSALGQDFDDFEVLVSGNNCTDDTLAVAEGTGDPRVRVITTGRTLAMPAHWEYVLNHVRGRFVLCLCDDDAMVPCLLSTLHGLINRGASVVSWNVAYYHHADCQIPERRNRLNVPMMSGKVARLGSQAVLKEMFEVARAPYFPKLLNSCNRTEVAHGIQRELGQVFLGSCPDYSYAALLLSREAEVVFVDRPLGVAGWSARSIGFSQLLDMGAAAKEHSAEFEEFEHFRRVPLKVATISNFIADTLEEVRATDMKHTYPRLDPVSYFLAVWSELQAFRERGVELGGAVDQVKEVISLLAPDVRASVVSRLEDAPVAWGHHRLSPSGSPPAPGRLARVRREVRRLINSSVVLKKVERSLRGPGLQEAYRELHAGRYRTIGEATRAVHSTNRALGWTSHRVSEPA